MTNHSIHPHWVWARSLLPRSILVAAALILSTACSDQRGGGGGANTAVAPDITGSYRLIGRDLPDGTKLQSPDVFGFLAFADGHRHFHFYAPGPAGERVSNSRVTTYTLTESEYSEVALYAVANNEITGSGLTYAFSAEAARSPVTLRPGTVEFREVGENVPILVFTAEGMTATLEGQFVDHWVKVQ